MKVRFTKKEIDSALGSDDRIEFAAYYAWKGKCTLDDSALSKLDMQQHHYHLCLARSSNDLQKDINHILWTCIIPVSEDTACNIDQIKISESEVIMGCRRFTGHDSESFHVYIWPSLRCYNEVVSYRHMICREYMVVKNIESQHRKLFQVT